MQEPQTLHPVCGSCKKLTFYKALDSHSVPEVNRLLTWATSSAVAFWAGT